MKKPPANYPIDPVVQRRLDSLERLIDSSYAESAKVFEQRTGIKMAQVNQWFSGYRALRDKALRRLEKETHKPHGFFDRAPYSEDDHSRSESTRPANEESMAADHAASAVSEALGMLGDVLRALDAPGREVAATMLGNYAKNPTEAELTRVSNVLAASVSSPPDEPPQDPAPGGKRRESQQKSSERRGQGKASLVLKIGGGNKQQFELPLQSLRKAIDNRNTSPNERAWYERVKAAPKAKE